MRLLPPTYNQILFEAYRGPVTCPRTAGKSTGQSVCLSARTWRLLPKHHTDGFPVKPDVKTAARVP